VKALYKNLFAFATRVKGFAANRFDLQAILSCFVTKLLAFYTNLSALHTKLFAFYVLKPFLATALRSKLL
jgi:hypothetical protein